MSKSLKVTTDKQSDWYRVDWDRLTFNDLIRIMRALDPRFSNNHPQFNSIEDLLIKDEVHAFYIDATDDTH
jgi:hypothetical protein